MNPYKNFCRIRAVSKSASYWLCSTGFHNCGYTNPKYTYFRPKNWTKDAKSANCHGQCKKLIDWAIHALVGIFGIQFWKVGFFLFFLGCSKSQYFFPIPILNVQIYMIWESLQEQVKKAFLYQKLFFLNKLFQWSQNFCKFLAFCCSQ